jgi:hypothetical protein
MISRISWAGVVLAAMLAVATVSLADDSGYRSGKGGIGGQLGVGKVLSAEDYSAGATTRFSFAFHWRYALAPWLRWQISPGFTWAGYDEKTPAPYRDRNFPADSTKAEYLALLLPASMQLQFTKNAGPWLFYAGGGPGVYRVWVENRRKVLKDPVSLNLHRGLYPGATVQAGVEHFIKALSSTSLEVTVDAHYVFAERDEQFPSGWNSKLSAVGVRIGGNYYFVPNTPKKKTAGAPVVTPTP